MPPRFCPRAAQQVTKGLGRHFQSPRRPRDKTKTQTLVHIPGQAAKRRRLITQLNQLEGKSPFSPPPDVSLTDAFDLDQLEDPDFDDQSSQGFVPSDAEMEDEGQVHIDDHPIASAQCKHRVLPNQQAQPIDFISTTVTSCKCATTAQILVHHGFFPTAPSQPRMAVSVELLSFYRTLFERSCDAINALAFALHTYYICQGYRMVNKNKEAIQEPFWRGLGFVVQWYNILQVEVERNMEAAIQRCHDQIQNAKRLDQCQPTTTTEPSTPCRSLSPRKSDTHMLPTTPSMPLSQPIAPLTRGSCSPTLTQHCPACFGGVTFGQSFVEGGDLHVTMDGNFHHRHCRSAGDCPLFYDPAYFLPKSQVDAMEAHVEAQHKRPAKSRKPLVPDETLDSCEASYEAADGNKQKTCMDSFNDTGIMALICRHDILLFFANIDSPGEQQKYSLALIAHLFSLLPQNATVVVLYDVGCTLDRTLSSYDILPPDINGRLRFATMAMHAYGHEWACQLAYNPHLSVGLGLSDGEGNERLWSRMIRLIGIERSSSRQRRIWLIDRQAAAVGAEMRMDLGDWIKHRLQRGVRDQGKVVSNTLDEYGIPLEEL
ncbi:hypothetical protein JVT61DRAFT_9515 [Boletus reticuloceps]|uniref:CxC1-like cysteine cluster associated with KDZ transposases domain-containing protein n=1 Tax=Boletus reticuloceps TaxID=495285 RepID=A0A8I3A5R3_9AGAM|nr:hypothetical protein JVT61DRAFT_9515 [Boletus reticuloceps]